MGGNGRYQRNEHESRKINFVGSAPQGLFQRDSLDYFERARSYPKNPVRVIDKEEFYDFAVFDEGERVNYGLRRTGAEILTMILQQNAQAVIYVGASDVSDAVEARQGGRE